MNCCEHTDHNLVGREVSRCHLCIDERALGKISAVEYYRRFHRNNRYRGIREIGVNTPKGRYRCAWRSDTPLRTIFEDAMHALNIDRGDAIEVYQLSISEEPIADWDAILGDTPAATYDLFATGVGV